jgi:hypothetical protein
MVELTDEQMLYVQKLAFNRIILGVLLGAGVWLVFGEEPIHTGRRKAREYARGVVYGL